MSVRVNCDRLRFEMYRRGWTRRKLARSAGISAATVNSLFRGTGVHPRTLQQIALALEKATPIESIDPLISIEGQDQSGL